MNHLPVHLAHFWYSEQQARARAKIEEPRVYARVWGRVVEYTEMAPIHSLSDLLSSRPAGTWDDYHWLGLGWFYGSADDPNGCLKCVNN